MAPRMDSGFAQSAAPYQLVDGTIIATDWSDLTDGELLAPVNMTETGEVVTSGVVEVWTGTSSAGLQSETSVSPDFICDGWTRLEAGKTGIVGLATQVDSTWTDGDSQPCTDEARLYCFSQ